MMLLGEKILKLSPEKEAKIDSTPLEASRYNKHADYNPHYECKMDKAHITMVGTYPVFMTNTKGVASDSPELINHIEALKKMNADLELYSADGGVMIRSLIILTFGITWMQNRLSPTPQMQ